MATEGMALGPANETTVESSNKQRSPYSGTESTKDQWVPEILGDDFPAEFVYPHNQLQYFHINTLLLANC